MCTMQNYNVNYTKLYRVLHLTTGTLQVNYELYYIKLQLYCIILHNIPFFRLLAVFRQVRVVHVCT